MRIGIVSIQKNRAPWLQEWVAFHHLVGVERFYVYAHNCSDGSEQVLQTLAGAYPLQAFSVRTNEDRIQLKVYQHALEQFGHECDWLAFIDGDEFLLPMAQGTLAEALAPYEHRRVSAIGVYWACYGSSGHVREPAGLVTRNYRHRAAPGWDVDRHVKSIVRGRQATRVGSNAHTFVTPWGTEDELGRSIGFGWTEHEPSYQRLRLNHYVTQSLQHFRQLKQRSGAADAGAAHVRPDDWWPRHDRNEQRDDTMARWDEALAREMARLAHLPLPAPGVLALAEGLVLPEPAAPAVPEGATA